MSRLARPLPLVAALAAILVALALRRPVDHDESQYVAAALLSADGWLPYRDYAYLQTPLQPFAFAPLAWAAGGLAWPVLRVANALLGVVVIAAAWRTMREAGVSPRIATAGAGLLAASDILLFSAGTARNDALPAALFALALIPVLRAERGAGTRGGALLAGLLLGAAVAAKISYALPAAAYGLYALVVRRHRPGWVAAGALPAIGLVAWTAAAAPAAFAFGVLTFPAAAPAEYYAAAGRLAKLSVTTKLVDVVKFLALGPAMLALVVVARDRVWAHRLLDILILAGLVAALLPEPTWRQYLLPMLVPLFVRLGLAWQARSPGRGWRIAAVVFACAGLAPSVEAIAMGGTLGEGMAVARAIGDHRAVATLSPQVLGRAPDRRFATGPFYFRSRTLLTAEHERDFQLVSQARLDGLADDPPAFILIGGEGAWSSGDDRLDAALERWAVANGYVPERRIGARFRLYARSRSAGAPSIAAR
ncbi:hypothetical protein ASE86_00330 [Sphingomonas sp. Leaf33]|uniref:hypothetical protein n=1 Tax=Sphingomonas sp. Leaf33 TaxID=1736215 RepID=UPI0006FBC68D|nr:hypothetical protein [Sphingomonas sp. Leaf33]KQN26739.1 hypothetical protein ASE86_00330 [Sphingomonas sp. Leaf33]